MSDPGNDPRLLEHEVDGIQELDNLLPRWWVWLFYLTIIFAAVYLLYFHVFKLGDLQAAAYARESRLGDAIKSAAITSFESSIGALVPSKDQSVIGEGRQIFLGYCAPCHRPDAGGLVGPNLCDDYWIHGSNYVDNLRTIIEGVPAKGMLTWRGVLKPSQIQAVGSFIYTLRGTHPPNPKPPENTVQAPAGPNPFE